MLLDGYQREEMEKAIMNDYSGILRCTEHKESIVDRYAEGYRQGYRDGRTDAKNEMKYAYGIEKGPSIEVRGIGTWVDKDGNIRPGGQNEDNKA